MSEEFDAWILRRLGRPATPALRDMIAAALDAGFGWFEASGHRLEFVRSLSDDRWEEIVIWIRATPSGCYGFQGARHSILTIDDRTRRATHAMGWLDKAKEDVA